MKRELQEIELEAVTGGSVILSAPMGVVGFNTLGKVFKIKGDVKEMRNLLLALYDANEDMNEKDFDTLVMNEYKSRGWI